MEIGGDATESEENSRICKAAQFPMRAGTRSLAPEVRRSTASRETEPELFTNWSGTMSDTRQRQIAFVRTAGETSAVEI